MTQEYNVHAGSMTADPEAPLFVALDLESTGLDPVADDIIEVGAVRFADARVLDMTVADCGLNRLVKPQPPKTIGQHISKLTGIKQAMVESTPVWSEIVDEVQAFLNPPVRYFIAHNIRFERNFLTHKQIDLSHLTLLDTYDMVHMFMPTASYADLKGVCHACAVPLTEAHRAAHDALATGQLFMRLAPRLQAWPDAAVQQILAHADAAWPYRVLFASVAAERHLPSLHTNAPVPRHARPFLPSTGRTCPDSERDPDPVPSASMAIRQSLQPGVGTVLSLPCGPTANQDLAQACVQWAREDNRHLLLCLPRWGEFSYLQRMLQDLQTCAATHAPGMRIAYRPNPRHLCDLERLDAWKAGRTLDHYDIRFLAKILHWCTGTDAPPDYRRLNNLFFFSHEPTAHDGYIRWPLVSGTWDSDPAQLAPGGEAFGPVQPGTGTGAITLMEHDALLLALDRSPDFARDFDGLVIDDLWRLFHQIPETWTQVTLPGSLDYLQERCRQFGSKDTGDEIADWLQRQPHGAEAVDALMTHLQALQPTLQRFTDALRALTDQYLDSGRNFADVQLEEAWPAALQAWREALQAWRDCWPKARALGGGLDALLEALPDIDADVRPDEARYIQQIRAQRQEWCRVASGLNQVLDEKTPPATSDPASIKWLTLRREGVQCEFKITSFWHEAYVDLRLRSAFDAVLCLQRGGSRRTSAPDFLSAQLGLNAFAQTQPPDTPYASALQIVAPDLRRNPDPAEVGPLAVEIAEQTTGCTLLLFTTRKALHEATDALELLLADRDLPLWIHHRDTCQTIAAALRQPGPQLLCGTYDLLQDIALDPTTLQCVVITRFPFPPPEHPIREERVRIALGDDPDGDDFQAFALPYLNHTLLRVLGHLITPDSPRGSLVVLDSRFHKPYIQGNRRTGRQGLIDTWPRHTRVHPPLARTAAMIGDWLEAG